MSNRLENHFGNTQWNSKVTWVKWKLASVYLEMVLILASDRCTACAKCITGWNSFWPHPMELLGDVGQMEAHLGSFGDSFNQHAR
jgi:hypothetical protein